MSRRDDEPSATIRREIAERGSISFDRFMDLALYGPGGFFHRDVVGADAEFVTSPHVHAFVFSRCIRGALLQTWSALGEPDVFEVVELGAGDGTLAAALIEAFEELPRPELRFTAVEIGEQARAALGRRGITTVSSLDELEPFEGAIVANELLDNLPFRLARREGNSVLEVRIALEGHRFVETLEPWRDAGTAPDASALREDAPTVVPVGGDAMIARIARTLRRGAALLVDYGDEGPATGAHGYARHRVIADVLSMPPGSSDITAGIDLAALAERARASGLEPRRAVRQRWALEALGYPRWNETMRTQQGELRDVGREADALRVFETRSRASILLDPEGLGGLWWLVLSTPDLPEPAWVIAAHERDRTDV